MSAADWPEETLYRDPDALRAWVDRSRRRALSPGGSLMAAKRSKGPYWPAPPDPGTPGVEILEFREGRKTSRRGLPEGVEVVEIGWDKDTFVVQMTASGNEATWLGLPVNLVARWSHLPSDLPLYDERTRMALFFAAGGVSTPALDARLQRHREHRVASEAAFHARQRETHARHLRVAAASGRFGAGALRPQLVEAVAATRTSVTVETLDPLSLPCLHAVPKLGKEPEGRTRFGGAPDVPEGEGWPHEGEYAYAFVGQIDLSTLPKGHGLPLPDSGLLQFFHGDVDGVPLVRLLPADARCERPEAPEEFMDQDLEEPYGEAAIEWVASLSLPTPNSAAYRTLQLDDIDDSVPYFDVVSALEPSDASTVGGYPTLNMGELLHVVCRPAGHRPFRHTTPMSAAYAVEMTQHDPGGREHVKALEEAATVAWYDERADQLEAEVLEWVVLLAVESHANLGMCFGDSGRLQYLIRLDDLRALRFDRVELMLWST